MERNNKRVYLILGLIFFFTFIINLLYMIGSYPGNMTIDSVNQFNQIATNQYNNYHPVFSTIIYKIPTLIYFSPASIIFAQILFFSIVVTYMAYSMFKYTKIKSWIIVVITVLFSSFLTNGFMLTNMWKDVPYSICIMLLTIFLFNIVSTDFKWLESKKNNILFVLIMASVALIRHNGVIVIIFTGLSLIIFQRKKNLKKYLLITITCLILFLGTEKILAGALHSRDTLSKADIVSVPLQQIAAVVQSNGKLKENEKEVLYQIAPSKVWSQSYNRYLSDNIKNLANDSFIKDPSLRGEVIKIYPSICANNFKVVTKAYLHQISIIWRLRGYERGALTFYTLEENDYGFSKHEIIPALTSGYKKILEVLRSNSILRFIFWNPAILMYIAILLIIISIVKQKSGKVVIIAMPMFANIASLLISIPAQDYRYLYANLLCLPILLFYTTKKKDNGEISD